MRNLFLTLLILFLGVNVCLATNMYDSSWFSYKNSINTWEFGSKLLDSDYLSNISKIFLDIMTRNKCTANVDTILADGVVLVDLTETFGAGNEPTKEWCDTHLNYFEGTIYISKDGYVANNLIANGSFENGNVGWSLINSSGNAAAIVQDVSNSESEKFNGININNITLFA